MGGSLRAGQGDAKCRAFPGFAFTGDRAAVGGDDFLHDREAETRTALVALTRNAEKAVEYVRDVLRRNADASVRDGEHDAGISGGCGERDATAARRVSNRIA